METGEKAALAEIDGRIALEVMGVKKVRGIFAYWKPFCRWEAYDPERHRQYLRQPEEELMLIYEFPSFLTEYAPAYSSEMHEAMWVVERMRGDGFSFRAWQPSKEPLNAGDPPVEHAVVSFVCNYGPCEKHGNPHCNHHGAYNVEAETLPLAICRAALLALKPAVKHG